MSTESVNYIQIKLKESDISRKSFTAQQPLTSMPTAANSSTLPPPHQVIQQAWASFGLMSDQQRILLVKGLMERCTEKETDYICSLLNFKLSESSQVPVYQSNEPTLPKQNHLNTRRLPVTVSRHPILLRAPNKTKQRPIIQASITNSNMYGKLIDSNYNSENIIRRLSNSPTEEIFGCIDFLCKRCHIFESVIDFLNQIKVSQSSENFLEKMLYSLLSITSSKYMTVYRYDRTVNGFVIIASTWDNVERNKVNESTQSLNFGKAYVEFDQVMHSESILETLETCSSYSVKRTGEYTSELENRYPKDIVCVLSIPIFNRFGDFEGIFEIINRSEISQYFSQEQEMILRAVNSVISYILEFERIKIGEEIIQQRNSNAFKMEDIVESRQADDLSACIEAVLYKVKDYTSADRVNYYALNAEKQQLILEKSSHDIYAPGKMSLSTTDIFEKEQFTYASNQGVPGKCATSKQVQNLKEPKKAPFYSVLFDKQMKYETLSTLCVPIVFGETVIGVLELLNKLPKVYSFSQDDENYVAYLCVYVNSLLESISVKEKNEATNKTNAVLNRYIENLLYNIQDVIFYLDDIGRVVWVNHPKMLSYADADVKAMKQTIYPQWLGETNAAIVEDIRKAMITNELINTKDALLIVNAHCIRVDYSLIPIPENARMDSKSVMIWIIHITKYE